MAQIRALDLPPHAVRFPYVSAIQLHLPKIRPFPILLIQRTIANDLRRARWNVQLVCLAHWQHLANLISRPGVYKENYSIAVTINNIVLGMNAVYYKDLLTTQSLKGSRRNFATRSDIHLIPAARL